MFKKMVVDIERLRTELINKCGRSIACIRAVEYYIQLMKNPCYPPNYKITTKARRYLMWLIEYVAPPRCDVKTLVVERLRGTKLEDLAEEIAAAAVVIKRTLKVTSRVAAALAALIVGKDRKITKKEIARLFGVSEGSLSRWKIRDALKVIAA
jgi:hypothetical protein